MAWKLLILSLVNVLWMEARASLPETGEGHIEQLRQIQQNWTNDPEENSLRCHQLAQGTIAYTVPLGQYDPSIRMPNRNKVFLITLDEVAVRIKAIFKPRAPLNARAEVAAYEIARYLEMDNLICPTVMRTCEGQEGVVSYFVDIDDNLKPWKKAPDLEKIHQLVSRQSLNNFYAFSRIFGMWDLKWVNVLFVGQSEPYSIMSIDNESLISPVYAPEGEHFYICWRTDPTCDTSPYEDLADFHSKCLTNDNINDYYEPLKRFFIQSAPFREITNEEELRQAITKRVKSFMWGKPSLLHFIGKKGWWIQPYANFSAKIPAPVVSTLDKVTLERFKDLTLPLLQQFFQDKDPVVQSFSQAHYSAILARRDVLLKNLESSL